MKQCKWCTGGECFVFNKPGFDIFDISNMNKHPGKVHLTFCLHDQ
ncbi:MAG TPA: hypothetical protein VJ728_11900 [Candidatus Binataceae bacterium]|nr:hypothetical protein [Candidatus Binataceae bacterium]